MMFKSDDPAIPGVFHMVVRWFTYLVRFMMAECSNVTRCVPLVNSSGPSSVLMRAGLSLTIMTPSSISVITFKWLG